MSNDESVAAFLRALAERAADDPAFAAHVRAALNDSGLAGAAAAEPVAASSPTKRARGSARNPVSAAEGAPPDPFSSYRAQGEAGLRATLDALDLATLRAIVRAHRLDPARISARWSARERVIALIVDQVRARANHGRAFERI